MQPDHISRDDDEDEGAVRQILTLQERYFIQRKREKIAENDAD